MSERRRECLRRYYALATDLQRDVASYEVMKRDSNIYRSIRSCWESFAAFRRDAGLPVTLAGLRSHPSAWLREWCINRYTRLMLDHGFQPNSQGLLKLDSCLYDCIRIQWGGFAAFCDDLKLAPARRRGKVAATDEKGRHDCREEYLDLVKRLGHALTSKEMAWHNKGLLKRILKLWGKWSTFRAEIGPV